VFGEAIAILAGDALLTRAFHRPRGDGSRATRSERHVSRRLARGGIWARPPARPVSSAARSRTWRRKAATTSRSPTSNGCTARRRARSSAPASWAAASSGAPSEDDLARLARFGDAIGLAFQVVDDILDATEGAEKLGKTAGKDARRGQGDLRAAAGARRRARRRRRAFSDAQDAIAPLGERGAVLHGLAGLIVDRHA
jgi:geranylgeranyl pyrophosphate synthase